jgi:hypothetical protein
MTRVVTFSPFTRTARTPVILMEAKPVVFCQEEAWTVSPHELVFYRLLRLTTQARLSSLQENTFTHKAKEIKLLPFRRRTFCIYYDDRSQIGATRVFQREGAV